MADCNNIVSHSLLLNFYTALKVWRIKDDLKNTLDFRSKSKIAVPGVLKQYWQWVSESETESKPKKIKRN